MTRIYFSLRQVLTIPYVLLTLLVAGIIGGLSYHAGSQAVSALSEELLRDMSSRISQAVDRHLVGSRVVLDAAFPDGMTAPESMPAEQESLRNRLWVAASLNTDPNNYVYYGNEQGQFAGVVRNADGSGEWRSGQGSGTPRRFYRFAGLNAPLDAPTPDSKLYDPRERPWYKAAIQAQKPSWSPVYVDNRTGELVATRMKPVHNATGRIDGIAATDVSLKKLTDFVHLLRVSKSGVAFVAERNGDMIASSSDNSSRLSDGKTGRVNAAQSSNELLRTTYAQVSDMFTAGLMEDQPQSRAFDGALGMIYSSVNVIRDGAGLEWITVVAVPRSDFMSGVIDNMTRTATIAVVAALLAMALGLWVLNWVSHDLRLLSSAARRLGEGHLYSPVGIARKDELGELARNFEAMHISLQTDRLTNVFNRETFEKQLTRRIEEHRSGLRPASFAVLFVDLDHFKKVNDRHGHQIGDKVLVEVADRLRHALRSGDIVGRYGGDEFVVLLHEIDDARAAHRVREKLVQCMREPVNALHGASGEVSASVGLACFPQDGDSPQKLLHAADQEMYDHKFSSRATDLK